MSGVKKWAARVVLACFGIAAIYAPVVAAIANGDPWWYITFPPLFLAFVALLIWATYEVVS